MQRYSVEKWYMNEFENPISAAKISSGSLLRGEYIIKKEVEIIHTIL